MRRFGGFSRFGTVAFATLALLACSTAALTPAPGAVVEDPTVPSDGDAGKTKPVGSSGMPGTSEPGSSGAPGGEPAGDGMHQTARAAGSLSVYVEPEEKAASVLTAIAGAKTSLALEMYLFSGYKFQDAIIAAKNRGVAVKVVLNKTFPSNAESSGSANDDAFTKLTNAGVPVVWAPARYQFTHAKTLIVDGKEVWIMTMNMTVTSPTSNREFIVQDRDAQDVAEAQQIFDADFAGRDANVTGRLVLSPHDATSPDAQTRIIDFLAAARHTVRVEASDLTDPDVCRAIMDAKGRGVDVRVLFDGQTLNDNEKTWAATFKGAGIEVKSMMNPDLHAKAIVIDGARAYLGSINFTTTSLYNNREVGLLFDDADQIAKVAATLDKDWAAAKPL